MDAFYQQVSGKGACRVGETHIPPFNESIHRRIISGPFGEEAMSHTAATAAVDLVDASDLAPGTDKG